MRGRFHWSHIQVTRGASIYAERQLHLIKCPLCVNYNAPCDLCVPLDVEGILSRKRLRICFCWLFKEGVYEEPKNPQDKPKRPYRATYILRGVDENGPILEVRKSTRYRR